MVEKTLRLALYLEVFTDNEFIVLTSMTKTQTLTCKTELEALIYLNTAVDEWLENFQEIIKKFK